MFSSDGNAMRSGKFYKTGNASSDVTCVCDDTRGFYGSVESIGPVAATDCKHTPECQPGKEMNRILG